MGGSAKWVTAVTAFGLTVAASFISPAEAMAVLPAAHAPMLVSGVGMTPAVATQTGWSTDAYEVELVTLTNSLRQQAGLSFLPTSTALREVARAWAIEMANAGEINHNPSLAKQVLSPWTKVGENVGFGPSIAVIHQSLIQSASHYKNIVDPSWTSMAVGATRMGRRIYIVELFELVPSTTNSAKARPLAIAKPRRVTVPVRR